MNCVRSDKLLGIFEKRKAVWIWKDELRQLGFHQKSNVYFQCINRFKLPQNSHISLFLHTSSARRMRRDFKSIPVRFELCEFHVTFKEMGHHIHFYFHEIDENIWELGGYSSKIEIERLGLCMQELRTRAKSIAQNFINELGGRFQ